MVETFDKGLYPTMGHPVGSVVGSRYKGTDLDPWEVNYRISHVNGRGMYMYHPEITGSVVRLDFLSGAMRSIFRWNRQYPLYLPGGKPWHKGTRAEKWGIVEISEAIPGHLAYPVIYTLFNYLNQNGSLTAGVDKVNVHTVQTVREIYSGNGTREKIFVGDILVVSEEELSALTNLSETEVNTADILVNGKRLTRPADGLCAGEDKNLPVELGNKPDDERSPVKTVTSQAGALAASQGALLTSDNEGSWVNSSGDLLDPGDSEDLEDSEDYDDQYSDELDSAEVNNRGKDNILSVLDGPVGDPDDYDAWSDPVESHEQPTEDLETEFPPPDFTEDVSTDEFLDEEEKNV